MAWSELQKIPDEHNDEFKTIDETILKLIQKKKDLSKGRRIFPPQDIIHEFAAQYFLDVSQINWLLHSLNHHEPPIMTKEPGELINVVPIMSKTLLDEFEYHITHAMQHEKGSIVNIEIKSENADRGVHIRPNLLLEVKGEAEYRIRRQGSRGGGGQAQLNFWVIPRLPDDIKEVEFSLIPFASPMESPPKEIILDQEVHFE